MRPLGLAAGASVALAVFAVVVARGASADADAAARGFRIVSLGTPRGAVACASCHAFDGAADPSGGFPRLAGQPSTYLRRALDSYADGSRGNAIMSPISKDLSDGERADVAAYYSAVSAMVPLAQPVGDDVLAIGRRIATVGLDAEQIPACAACHGPFGRSVTATIPSLRGQYARYIVHQLGLFRSGRRKAGAAAMASIAHALTDEQSAAVAAYFQQAGGQVPPGATPVATMPSALPAVDARP